MTRDILLSQAIEGFLMARSADGYSPATLNQYKWGLDKVLAVIDRSLSEIDINDLRKAMTSVQASLGPQSIFHVWKAIKAFYKWASAEGLVGDRPDSKLNKPRFQQPPIEPFSVEEIKKLVSSVERTKPSEGGKPGYTMRRPTALRDKAIILILLDTGIRASELARLEVRDLDLTAGTITVRPFQSGLKSRGRVIPMGKGTRQAIWRYHASREDMRSDDPVFCTARGEHPLNRGTLLQMLIKLGDRAGVPDCHPHRFRHTFAIQFLRNGGDVFTLQRLLGHNSLEMVRHYVNLAQSDVEEAYRKNSPVDRMRL